MLEVTAGNSWYGILVYMTGVATICAFVTSGVFAALCGKKQKPGVYFLIRRRGEGEPQYFSAAVGINSGSRSGGWVGYTEQAMQFAREKDAQAFIRAYLPPQIGVRVVRIAS